MKKIILALAAITMLATPAFAVVIEGGNKTNGESYVTPFNENNLTLEVTDGGIVSLDGVDTGITINNNYDVGAQAKADLIDWIVDQTGMMPSKLVKYVLEMDSWDFDHSYNVISDGSNYWIKVTMTSKKFDNVVLTGTASASSVLNAGIDIGEANVTVDSVDLSGDYNEVVTVTLSNGESLVVEKWGSFVAGRTYGQAEVKADVVAAMDDLATIEGEHAVDALIVFLTSSFGEANINEDVLRSGIEGFKKIWMGQGRNQAVQAVNGALADY